MTTYVQIHPETGEDEGGRAKFEGNAFDSQGGFPPAGHLKIDGPTGVADIYARRPETFDAIAAAASQAAADLRTLIHRAEAKATRKPDPDTVIGQGGEIVPDLATADPEEEAVFGDAATEALCRR